jgi:hypothetical protein
MNAQMVFSKDDLAPMPLVARFSTIRYDYSELESELSCSFITSESSHPTTYSATTNSGRDNDRDDKGED